MIEPRPVVFVAPFFAETTLRFVEAVASLPNVSVGLLSQDPASLIPIGLRRLLSAHEKIEDGLDTTALVAGVRRLSARIGHPARLIGALEQLQEPLAEVRHALGIEGADLETARNFRDKSRMKDLLRRHGIPCAHHGLARTSSEAQALAVRLGFPLVAKPPAGAGAQNTVRVEDQAGLLEYMASVPPSSDRPLLLEEFVRGEEHSFDSVSIDGRPVWHSLTHYRPGPLEVMETPWIQWTVLLPREVDHPRYDDIRGVAARALDVLGMGTGLAHMEWFRREDGSLAISEVASRPPGAQFTTLISYAHDVDFYRAWARLMVFDRFDPPERRYAAGIAFLRGQGRGRVNRIRGLRQAQKELGSLIVESRLPRSGQMQASSYEGEGFAVLRHPETQVVAAGLARLVELIHVELA